MCVMYTYVYKSQVASLYSSHIKARSFIWIHSPIQPVQLAILLLGSAVLPLMR